MINREISIMMRLQHPSIIKFYGYSLADFKGRNNVTIIMNIAKNGSLRDHLQKVQKGLSDKNYDNTMRQKILIGISRGMMYLHKHHIIHRDLKPENIILDEDFNPLITDFGLSKYSEAGQSANQTQYVGTSSYMAPEIINGNQYNAKADVYSFGIIMYEVITDSIPYPLFQSGKMPLFQFNNKVVNEGYRPEFTVPVQESLMKLIEKCWSKDPNQRPTFEQLFNKLAFNVEESVYDVLNQNDSNYYLDNVEVDELFNYIDKITENEENKERPNSDSNNKIQQQIENLTKNMNALNNIYHSHVTKLSQENQQLKLENEQMKKQVEKLNKDVQSMKKFYDGFISKLTQENQEMKKDICNLKSQFKPSERNSNPMMLTESNSKPQAQALTSQNSYAHHPTAAPQTESNGKPQAQAFTSQNPYAHHPTAAPQTESIGKPQIPTTMPYYDPPISQITASSLAEFNGKLQIPASMHHYDPPISQIAASSPAESNGKPQVPAFTPYNPPLFQPITGQNINIFTPRVDSVFDGIINFLKKNNLYTNVRITSSLYSGSHYPSNVTIFDDDQKYFKTSSKLSPGFICFDFIYRFVNLAYYQIQSTDDNVDASNLSSWVVEGLIDDGEWETIDSQTNCSHLNGSLASKLFTVTTPFCYRYIRIRQTEPDWKGSYAFALNKVEFYGKLAESSQVSRYNNHIIMIV